MTLDAKRSRHRWGQPASAAARPLLLRLGARNALLSGDEARWIRTYFSETLAALADTTMMLDWQLQ